MDRGSTVATKDVAFCRLSSRRRLIPSPWQRANCLRASPRCLRALSKATFSNSNLTSTAGPASASQLTRQKQAKRASRLMAASASGLHAGPELHAGQNAACCQTRDGQSLRSSALVREALQERLKSRSPHSRVREIHVTVAGRANWNHHLGVVRCGW
jgi:hypothetical protein